MGVTFAKKTSEAEPNSLRYHLHKALRSSKPGRDLKNLHASDMTKGFCPRERLIRVIKGMEPDKEHINAPQQMVFDLGNAVESIVVRRAAEAGIAYGDWQCPRCDLIYRWRTRPERCTDCGSQSFVYRTRRLYSEKSGISCGIDLLVRLSPDRLTCVEIKTMQKDDFKKLVAPLAEHKLRTNLYMRIARESADEGAKMIDHEQALVLYVDKGGYGILDGTLLVWKMGDKFSPFKEFVVKRDDSMTDEMSIRAAAYKQALLTKTICAGICTGPVDGPAQKCRVAKDCFSGAFPTGAKF